MGSQALTNAERARIREGHAAGMSVTALATELGRSKATISKYAKLDGLDWSKGRTAAATEAKVATNRDKRARLEERLLDEAALLLDQLHAPHLVYSFGGRDNTYAEHLLPEPDIGGKRSLVQAATTATTQALKLAEADKAADGAQAGASMVGSLMVALAMRAPESEQAMESTKE